MFEYENHTKQRVTYFEKWKGQKKWKGNVVDIKAGKYSNGEMQR